MESIADGLFKELIGYRYGIHFASYHVSEKFMTHVKIMRTEFKNVENAKAFALSYVVLVALSPSTPECLTIIGRSESSKHSRCTPRKRLELTGTVP